METSMLNVERLCHKDIPLQAHPRHCNQYIYLGPLQYEKVVHGLDSYYTS